MAVKFTNNAKTTLASSLTNVATSASVVDGSVFPTLGAGEYFYCTFDDGSNNEIVKVTARSGNTLTIVRGVDNTTARAFSSGDAAELRATAGLLTDIQENIAAKSANQTVYNTTTASSATSYDIGIDPSVEANAMVFLNGVMQHHDTFSFSGSTLTFDTAPSDGMALEVIVDNLINLQSSNLTVDTFTAADVGGNPQTDFTLSDTPAAETNLIVFVDGVFQDQDAYTISTNVLTMTDGVVADRVVTVYVINPVNIGTPSDGTVTSAKLSGNITMPANLTVTGDVAFDSPTFVVDNANSRVGIGIATPSTLLDIVGDVKMSADLTVDTDTLYVDSTNNRVGIGDSAPATKLEILDANGVGLRFGDVAATPSSQTAGYIGMSTSAYSGNNGDLVLIPRTSVASKILLMEASVGIGTSTTFSNPLTLNKAAGAAGSLNNQLALTHTGASTAYYIKTIRASADDEPVGLAFFEHLTERMRIDSSGNVGVGTINPGAKLDIHMSDSNGTYGRGLDGNLNLENTNTSVTEGGWLSISGYTGNATSQYTMGAITGGKQTSAADGDYGGYLSFWNTSGGANGEANSGMYERMRIDSSGNVGINTTSPQNKLHISGNLTIDNSSNAPYIDFVENADTTDSKARIAMDQIDGSNGQLQFYNEISGTLGERLRILGNNLHLNGGADCRIQLGSGGAGANSTSNNTVHIRGDNTSLKFMAASGGDTIFEQNGTSRFVFGTNDWYFGNYTNATETLNFRTSSNGTTKFNFYDANSTEGCYIKHTGQTYGGIITYGARWDDDEDKMVINLRQASSGGGDDIRVGIGTTNPTSPFHVSATHAGYVSDFVQGGSGGGNHGLRVVSGSGSSYSLIVRANASTVFYVDGAGNYYFSGSNQSDVNKKENIADLTDNALDLITQLQPKTYNFIGSDIDKAGFIAQEMEQVIPRLVTGNEFDADLTDEDGNNPTGKGIDYMGYTAYLTKAIQELTAKLEAAEARITELENN